MFHVLQVCPVNSAAERNSAHCWQWPSSQAQPSMLQLTTDRCWTHTPKDTRCTEVQKLTLLVCWGDLFKKRWPRRYSKRFSTLIPFSLTGVPGFPTPPAPWDNRHQQTKMLLPWIWLWPRFLMSASPVYRWPSHGIWAEHSQMQWVQVPHHTVSHTVYKWYTHVMQR